MTILTWKSVQRFCLAVPRFGCDSVQLGKQSSPVAMQEAPAVLLPLRCVVAVPQLIRDRAVPALRHSANKHCYALKCVMAAIRFSENAELKGTRGVY
ncbi:unnamed protein product [Boreogadus saida]